MDLAHGRSSLKLKPLFALSTGRIALSSCDSADLVGLWQLNEASNTGARLSLMQNYNKGKSDSSLSEDWLKPPEPLAG